MDIAIDFIVEHKFWLAVAVPVVLVIIVLRVLR